MRFYLLLSFFALGSLLSCGPSEGAGEEKQKRIAVIPKGTTHIFWKSIHAGSIKAANELGIEAIWQGPLKEDDRQMQIQVVQNFISQGVDGIVLAPLDSRALIAPVKAAQNRGIPVIIIDSGLEEDAYKSFIATNNLEGGKMCAKRLAELLGERGKVIMMRYMEGSASTTAREKGFMEAIQSYPEIEIISDNQFAGATMEKAFQASQNLLNRFPEVDGIFCPNESSTQGMLRALQTAGRTASVQFVGFDSNPTLIQALEKEEIKGLLVQDPFDMGYLGVKTMAEVLEGKEVANQIDTRVMMITPENMQEEEAQALLKPDIEAFVQ
ncbi:MAG: substrate-binding domain-containing protein [Bacteroidota bacterium]